MHIVLCMTMVTHRIIFTKYNFFYLNKIFGHNRYPVTLRKCFTSTVNSLFLSGLGNFQVDAGICSNNMDTFSMASVNVDAVNKASANVVGRSSSVP